MSVLQQLKEQGHISDEQLKEIEEGRTESEKLELLEEKHIVSGNEIAKARAKATGLQLAVLAPSFQAPSDLLAILPQDVIKRYKVLPIRKIEDGRVEIGLVEPENVEASRALHFIEVSEGIRFSKVVITGEDFRQALQKVTDLELEVKEALKRLGEEGEQEKEEGAKKKIQGQEELQRLVQEAPVTQMVDVILKYGVDGGASDIHIEPTMSQVRVRYRMDGKLKSSLFLPKELTSALVTRIKIMARLRVDETRVPQGGRIHIQNDGKPIDFRVSTLPIVEGEKVVIRILDPTKGIVKLEQLGLQNKAIKDIQAFMERPFGAMLISGPTGSGKSTTLYSVLNQLNQEAVNIVTLEDPVEYFLSGVNQSQVRPEIKYTFASGLREVLRQDPNIVMVGEVRDKETAELLIHAALTGHLVFSTIHTNDSIGIIPRLLDMGIDSFLIPSALRLAVAQRLVPKLCSDCKKPYEAAENIIEQVRAELEVMPKEYRQEAKESEIQFFKAEGCQACGKLGTKGRIAVFETLVVDNEVEKAIVENASESTFRTIAKNQGMISMRQDGILKALKGTVSIEAVMAETAPTFVGEPAME